MPPKIETDMAGGFRRGVDAPPLQQRLDLGGGADCRAVVGVVQRLDAERITPEQQSAPIRVPDDEGIHAAQAMDKTGPMFLVEMEQHLGV